MDPNYGSTSACNHNPKRRIRPKSRVDIRNARETNMDEDRNPNTADSEQEERQSWEEPKLTYVVPKLVEHGDVEKITAGFFGSFSP